MHLMILIQLPLLVETWQARTLEEAMSTVFLPDLVTTKHNSFPNIVPFTRTAVISYRYNAVSLRYTDSYVSTSLNVCIAYIH